jgi:hypothetical protein
MGKQTKVFHPYLFAILPVILLYSQNVGEVLFRSVFWPMAITLAFSAILLIFAGFCHVNKYKAGLIVTVFWAYFFMYANISGLFRETTVWGLDLYRYSLILPVWTVLFGVYVLIVLKWKYELVKITKIANIVALCLIVTSSITITSHLTKNRMQKNTGIMPDGQSRLEVPPTLPSELPDIYYIILDQHVSNDIFEAYFNFDNSAFADGLRERGFFFAEKSRSNYSQTRLSLASSLNFQYMDILTERYGSDSSNTNPMLSMVKHNRLTSFLKSCGYKTAAFSSSYKSTELRNSDYFFSKGWSPDEYQAELLNNTILLPFITSNMTYEGHRQQVLFPIENISKVTELDSPVFTLIHIICPHHPYVFDENGPICEQRTFRWTDDSYLSQEERNKKYIAQVKYIDRKITEAIDVVLEKSDTPPVIILQSDHGTRWKFGPITQETDYRPYFGILNAYYLPDFDQAKLYDSITPVNSFRLILNHYFGTDLELLEDKTYYSTFKKPYDFTDTTKESDRTSLEVTRN